MNVEVIRKPKTNVVPMYNMNHGQFGVVVGTLYTGTVVKAFISLGSIHVFSLDNTSHYWNWDKPGCGGGVDVELIEPFSVVKIVVPEKPRELGDA